MMEKLRALGECPKRRDEFAVGVSARRTGISVQARLSAHRLDSRYQIHFGLAATAANNRFDHGLGRERRRFSAGGVYYEPPGD